MTTGAPAGEETSVLCFHRLHYGKLAEGEDRRTAASAGYAITRRSHGLDPAWDPFLSPLRLTELRRFEPDAVDIDARGAGCFVARAIGGGMAFMRARFRPEDGEQGVGRLHQQTAIWLASFDAWRAHPAACLAIAGREARALPDLLSEDEGARLNDPPLRWRVSTPEAAGVRRILERAPWAVPLIETLLDGAESGAEAVCDFGAHDFARESDFLSAAGLALQALPPSYPRWRDISVVSGLVTPVRGLCLRYVPSWGRARAAA